MLDKLRIGILIPARVPAWVGKTLGYVKALPGVELTVILQTTVSPPKNSLHALHLKLDHALFRPKPNAWEDSLENTIPDDVPHIELREQDACSQLSAFNLDVIINLALSEYPRELMEGTRFGVWTLHDGRTRFVANSPLGWQEPFQHEEIATCAIEISRKGLPARLASNAFLATDMYSISRNQMHLLWKGSTIIPYAIGQLMRQGGDDFFSNTRPVDILAPHSPSKFQLFGFLPYQVLINIARKIRKSVWRDQWGLFLKKGQPAALTWEDYRAIMPPKEYLWADPFVIEYAGQTYLFIEELFYVTKRGHINCLTLDGQGQVKDNRTVLERPYHLSFPFVFEYRGEIYMLPETRGNNSIEVYRCKRFPDQWEFHKTLMKDVRATDTILVEYMGHWWMFTTVVVHGNSAWDTLHLFYADNPLSDEWTPHPLNPVSSDVRTARMAGRIFLRNGQLIRPSQDSSHRYGFALNLNRIDILTTTNYAETRIDRLEPPGGSNIQAVHTFNFSQNWTVMDATIRTRKY